MAGTARERLFATREGRITTIDLLTGDKAEIHALGFSARTKLVKACTEDGEVNMEQLAPRLVIACTVDPVTSTPMFTDGDFETLCALPAIEMDPLWTAAAELNGLGTDAVKVAEKN